LIEILDKIKEVIFNSSRALSQEEIEKIYTEIDDILAELELELH
jgi:hypothetical protein